jgi:hypothetical protein
VGAGPVYRHADRTYILLFFPLLAVPSVLLSLLVLLIPLSPQTFSDHSSQIPLSATCIMASVDEKAAVVSQHESPAVSQHENVPQDASRLEQATHDIDHGLSPAEQRHIIRRIDRRLVVMLGVMYCVSLMDRTNMSAAAIAGMRVELNLVNNNHYVSNPPHTGAPCLALARFVSCFVFCYWFSLGMAALDLSLSDTFLRR